MLRLPRKAGVTAGAIAVSLLEMALLDAPPEQAMLEGVLALVWSGVITLKQALAGFASEGVVSVAVMCAVSKGVQARGPAFEHTPPAAPLSSEPSLTRPTPTRR